MKRVAKKSRAKPNAKRAPSSKARRPSAAAKNPGSKVAKPKSAPPTNAAANSASELIDQRIADVGGWRAEMLARMRTLIHEADPEIVEEWKWDVPVWSHHGIVCTGEVYKNAVKLTFARGAATPDPTRLFNSSLAGNTRRAIDIHEGKTVEAAAFKALIRAAVAQNSLVKGR